MKRKLIIIGIILTAAIGLSFLIFSRNTTNPDSITTPDTIYEPSAENGNIPEKIIGDHEKAKVVLFEYADYGCSHCAEWNKKINDLLKEYGDKLAVVFRSYNLGYKNGESAARAATAAQMQGYFKEYKDLLFSNQVEWFYAEDGLEELFTSYFKVVSAEKGDTEKFLQDMQSENIKLRNKFENSIGKKLKLTGTPMFRIDGEVVPANKLIDTIKAKIENH